MTVDTWVRLYAPFRKYLGSLPAGEPLAAAVLQNMGEKSEKAIPSPKKEDRLFFPSSILPLSFKGASELLQRLFFYAGYVGAADVALLSHLPLGQGREIKTKIVEKSTLRARNVGAG